MRRTLPLLLLLLAGCTTKPPESVLGMRGQVAPDFTVESLDSKGSKAKLSDLKGKVVLLDFFATWCGPCREASPEIERVYRRYKSDGLAVMSISTEDRRTLEEYHKESKTTYPYFLDPFQEATVPYEASSLPTFIIVGRDGKIVDEIRGYAPGVIEEAVAKAMEAA